ncbi:hypothetical protein Peur_010023 [Populus x canadensis]
MKARIEILEYHGFLFVNCQTLKETDTKGRIPLRFYDLSFEQRCRAGSSATVHHALLVPVRLYVLRHCYLLGLVSVMFTSTMVKGFGTVINAYTFLFL